MRESPEGSPLLIAVLAVIGSGATAQDVAERMAAAGAQLQVGSAQSGLDELSRLGLVRITGTGKSGKRYVTTGIGQRRLEDSLAGDRDEVQRLAELEQLRTDLLSTIAHELRTPLTAVRTSVSLLLDTEHAPDDDQRATLLATIDRNALRMQRLVGDILDLSRFRAGSIQLKLRRFDARELAEGAVASVGPLVEAAHQELALVTPSTPVWVFGDYRRLEQALVNLLSNAQKFSPEGAVVDIEVSEGDGLVCWRVTDRGPGISEADQSRLFERFFVGPSDRTGGGRGVGLGLPTTLAIAQAHRGRIDVRSELGEGSTFMLLVPAEGPEPESTE
jgi:signal transduction histidine kinase